MTAPVSLDVVTQLVDAVAQLARERDDATAQYIHDVQALDTKMFHFQAVRIEALERLLVAKGIVTPEELHDALSTLHAEVMIDTALDPPAEEEDAGT